MLKATSHALVLLALALPAHAQTWTPFGPTGSFPRISFDESSPAHLLITTGGFTRTAQETFDGGATWTPVPPPSTSTGSGTSDYQLDSRGNLYALGVRFASTTGIVCRIMTPTGWQPFGPAVTAPFVGEVIATRVTRGLVDPDLVVLETDETDTFGSARLYVSSDGGATWSNGAMVARGSLDLDIVENQGAPYIVRYANGFGLSATQRIVQRSQGFGPPTSTLLQVPGLQLEFGLAKRHANAMWALVGPTNPGGPAPDMRASTDGGSTWASIGSAATMAKLAVHPTRPGCLVRAIASTMELSIDGGSNWRTLDSPQLTGVVQEFEWSPDGRHLYAWSNVTTNALRADVLPRVGVHECSARVNSTGAPARIYALGSNSLASNDLALVAEALPANQFGMFVVSRDAGFAPNPGGSLGDLCLGGAIGRYSQLLQSAGAYGFLSGNIDVTAIPTPNTLVSAQVGETWRFQAWFRDDVGGVQGSNFSDAVAVTFTP